MCTAPVIGHRGACGHAPENTLASIREAARLGARWVEFDVKLTADGEAILFHDDTLERTTDGAGPVAAMPLERIRALDAGSWFAGRFRGERVPTLAEAMQVLAALGLGANVEIKPCPGREIETAEAVARIVAREWPAAVPPPVISSFRPECLAVVRDRQVRAERALLVLGVPGDWARLMDELGCTALHALARRLDRGDVDALRAAGRTVRCFTVNDPWRARELFEWGVAAVFTDYPDRYADITGG